MKIFKTYTNLPEEAKHPVIAIGNFDGVHKGHQALLDTTKKIAQDEGVPSGVLTFEPHPRRLFRPDDPPFRITPIEVKEWRLNSNGIDTLYMIPFDWEFASQSYSEFIDNVLDHGIEPRHIVVGYDFCFGQLRKGTIADLKKAGYPVTVIDKKTDKKNNSYSSSNVRTALRHGKIQEANNILGWDWELRGEIKKGDQRGRELGYPTANVPIGEALHPAYGVYATLVKILEDGDDAQWMPAATNIGIRPMFEIPIGQVEAHILDFDRDIYGCTLRVKLLEKLRGEAKFDSIEELITQIDKDCIKTRYIIDKNHP